MEKRIYENNHCIKLTDRESSTQLENYFTINHADELLKALASPLRENDLITLFHPDFTWLWTNFCNFYTIIQAAGGYIENENKEKLFIFRRGKWDLPKGKMEAGETPEEAAAREITEETGIVALHFTRTICETYHIYTENNKKILKISHWFHFRSHSNEMLLPQAEEDITAIKWFAENEINIPLQNTYSNIIEVVNAYTSN